MKILIADKLSKTAITELEKLGGKVTFSPDLSADDLPGSIGDAEILIVRSTKVKAATIEAAKNLSLIIRAGAGVNTIDLEKASSLGVSVANCPGTNTDAVAELAIGHLIAADRCIVAASQDMRDGKWRKKEYGKAQGLKGRTLGVVGLGAIGKAVVKRAKGLDMDVVAWSRSLTPEKAEALGVGYCKDVLELAGKADAVSVHLASKPDTKHIINEAFLSKMKDGAILVNAARGEVLDTAALKQFIKSKNLKVGLDVFENEPAGGEASFEDKELAHMIACTPHIGASTNQAAEAVASTVVQIVKSYADSGKPINTVNIQQTSPAKSTLVVRHYNHVGVLASVLDELRSANINIEEMENTVFAGGNAASCALQLDDSPAKECVEKIGQNKEIIQVMLK